MSDFVIQKADDEHRVVYGVVLEPDQVGGDTQGDVVSKEDVELAAWRFLYNGARIGDQHRRLAPDTVRPVESYIAPADFTLGDEPVKKGSWVLAVHVPDDELWEQVKKGGKAAWSVAGSGRRVPLEKQTLAERAAELGASLTFHEKHRVDDGQPKLDARLEQAAEQLRKVDPTLTSAQSVAKALENDPSLY